MIRRFNAATHVTQQYFLLHLADDEVALLNDSMSGSICIFLAQHVLSFPMVFFLRDIVDRICHHAIDAILEYSLDFFSFCIDASFGLCGDADVSGTSDRVHRNGTKAPHNYMFLVQQIAARISNFWGNADSRATLGTMYKTLHDVISKAVVRQFKNGILAGALSKVSEMYLENGIQTL